MATETDVVPTTGFLQEAVSPSPSPVRQPDEKDVFDFVGLEDVPKFVEREHLLVDPFEYPRNGPDPGLVLIFNLEKFAKAKERKGSRRDVNELVLCLQRLGFNIEKDSIMHNFTTDQIKKRLKDVSKMDLKKHNSLIIFFFTHGKKGDKLLTSDDSIYAYDIWKNFTECEDLKDRPKMFVFQACKGDNYSTSLAVESKFLEEQEPTTKIVKYPTHMGPDMLVVYSTIEGHTSFRSPFTGTWFVQELCKNFNAYGKRDDVVTLLTRTAKCVSGNYFRPYYDINQKQMPVYMSTLSKKFYLNRNKDRAMVLMYRSCYEDILRQVQDIKERLDTL